MDLHFPGSSQPISTRVKPPGTKVTGAGLKELAGLKNFSSRDLSQTRVTDEGLKHLTGLSGLRTLDVTGTEISAGGLAALVNILPDLKVTR